MTCATAQGRHMKQRVVFVDVDDTLVRSVGTKRIPMPPVVARVRKLHQQGVALYLWSSGGANYARAAAEELGIAHCFLAFLPKPDTYLDDQSVQKWRYCRHVLPGNASDA
jgi:cation transport ATPase